MIVVQYSSKNNWAFEITDLFTVFFWKFLKVIVLLNIVQISENYGSVETNGI